MTTTTINPILGNHIMDTTTYQNNSYDGFATPSIGLSGGIRRRGILKFSLPSANSLSYSILSLLPQDSYSSQTYYVWRILRAITSSVTWLKYDGTNSWASGGGLGTGDVYPTALGSVTTAVTKDIFFDISLNAAEVLKMMNGTYENNGFLITSTESSVVMVYYNYNYTYTTFRPKLYLDYSSTQIGKVSGVSYSYMKKISNVGISSVKKISGVQ